MEFEKIAPYLEDPLVLTGFSLLLFFGFGRAMLREGVIPTLSRAAGFQIISKFLLYGFLLALAVIALGFGLKYRDLSRAEQERAVLLLHQELAGNLAAIRELEKNIRTITGATDAVSQVMRHPGIKIMAALFPRENLDPNATLPASLDLSRSALQAASEDGLLDDQLEVAKFNQAAQAIAGTIKRTKTAISSLSDNDHSRYVIESQVWENHLPILRKVEIVSAKDLQSLYQEMRVLRTSYDVSVRYSIGYVEAIEEFFSGEERTINAQRLAALLAAERIFTLTIADFSESFDEKVEAISETLNELAL